jgi:hypothetical protein
VSLRPLWHAASGMRKVSIVEVRTVQLPLKTVVDAILEFDYAHRRAFCGGKLQQVRVEDGDDPAVVLRVQHGTGEAAESRFALAAVAAAIIQYFAKSDVPLPRKSTKSITIVPDGLELTLRSRIEVPERHCSISATWHPQPETSSRKAPEVDRPGVNSAGDAALYDPTYHESEDQSSSNAA